MAIRRGEAQLWPQVSRVKIAGDVRLATSCLVASEVAQLEKNKRKKEKKRPNNDRKLDEALKLRKDESSGNFIINPFPDKEALKKSFLKTKYIKKIIL